MNHNLQKIAILDFDGTLIDGQSQKLLVNFLFKKGFIKIHRYIIIMIWFFLFKLEITRNIKPVLEFAIYSIKDKNKLEMDFFFDSFFEDICKPLIYINSIELVKLLRENGYYIILVSTAIDQIIYRVKDFLKIDHVICTRLEIINDIFSGKIIGEPIFDKIKVVEIKSIIDSESVNKGNILIFADHYTDIDLLNIGSKSFVVNPSRKLLKCAKTKKWSVLYLNSNESFQHFKFNTKF